MRTTLLAVFASLALAACGGDDPERFPAVEGRWRVDEAGIVVCDAPSSEVRTPEGAGPHTSVLCTWDRVSYGGANHCWVAVSYHRANTADPWPEPVVTPSTADCTAD